LLLITLNGLILLGIAMLMLSLVLVRKIIRLLPLGSHRKSWYILAGLIIFFVLSYVAFLVIFWNQKSSLLHIVAHGIFFFGAIFVLYSSFVALQTTTDLLRMGDLEQQTFTDPLTGVYNRRFMQQRLAEEISKARRYSFSLSVLMFDLDFFKRINDEHGHQAGDQVLIETCVLINHHLRDSDILSRYGGEEFLIIAPNTGPSEARLMAERLRTRIEAHGFLQNFDGIAEAQLSITASFGLASFSDDTDNPEALINDADKNLYQAKNRGRNRVAG
jgi:diguanylate cyclase (GGDEF)-like protein